MPKNSGRFKKGIVPWNKGISFKAKGSEKGHFKKGSTINCKPLGYERLTEEMYVEVKYQQPNVFKLKQRLIYQWYTNETLTPKDIIIFLDANTLNFRQDNLIKITRAELCILNTYKFRTYPLLIKKMLILHVKLICMIKKQERKLE